MPKKKRPRERKRMMTKMQLTLRIKKKRSKLLSVLKSKQLKMLVTVLSVPLTPKKIQLPMPKLWRKLKLVLKMELIRHLERKPKNEL